MTGKQNPVPGLVIGVNDPPPTVNQAVQQWARQVSPVMYGTGAPLFGTLPVPSAPSNAYLSQMGAAVVAFTSGNGSLTFPRPFPNGVLSFSGIINDTTTTDVVSLSYGSGTSLTAIPLVLNIDATAITLNVTVVFTVVGW